MTTAADAPREFDLVPGAEPLTRPDRQISASLAEPIRAQRLTSLDVFRGITIAAMLLVNNPGIGKAYKPLGHVDWDGWTPTDLIFPFFLFIVGVAIPFSFAKRSASETRGEMFLHVWSRALSLILLGLLLAAIPFRDVGRLPEGYTTLRILRWVTYIIVGVGMVALLVPWRSRKLSLLIPPVVAVALLAVGLAIHFATKSAMNSGLSPTFSYGNGLFRASQMRFPGVLQRIGICYGVAATIALLAGWRTVLVSFVLLCTAYSFLMLMPPDGGTPSLSPQDNFARRIDERVFDRYSTTPDGKRVALAKHTYGEYPDPEGILSTLPAIGSVLLGILVGYSLRRTDHTNAEKGVRLLANGVLVAIAGVLLSWWLMPINKKIWTPSFAVFTAGMAMLTLGAIFYLTDIKGRRAWAWPFKVYGMNAIAAFVLAGILVRIGTVVQVTNPETGLKVDLLRYCKLQAAEGVHRAGEWWARVLPMLPPLDTPGNTSLAFSLGFVLVVLLILSVMYAFKIFLKV